MTTAFISDLHLSLEQPGIYSLWLKFLAQASQQYENVFILGDLFEYWVGDDGAAELGHRPSIKALRKLSNTNVRVFFMHGNRDFLIGETFARETGCTILKQPHAVILHGQTLLLMHGDSLCTDDIDHQKWRELALSEAWQIEFLTKSLAQRIQTAQNMRDQSEQGKKLKSVEIMDVNAQAVNNAFSTHGMTYLIHGHTHRQAMHNLEGGKQRIVLADWYETGSVLELDEDGFRFVDLA